MSWHVASRSAISTHGIGEPLAEPLDGEYARLQAGGSRSTWWRPQQRLGQVIDRPFTGPPTLQLPKLQTYAKPIYPPSRAPPPGVLASGPILREHIYMTRPFRIERRPQGEMSGSVPLAAVSTPVLGELRGVKPPRTPTYDRSVYDKSWTTSVNGYFGQPH